MWDDAVYLSVLSCICHVSKFQEKNILSMYMPMARFVIISEHLTTCIEMTYTTYVWHGEELVYAF